jgi:sporulation protein YlmC with PRC-barrel domain
MAGAHPEEREMLARTVLSILVLQAPLNLAIAQEPSQRLDRDAAGNDVTAPLAARNNGTTGREAARHAEISPGLPLSPAEGGDPGAGNLRASQLKGYKVLLGDGQELGKVDDVILTPETGRIAYLQVTAGSVLNLNRERYDIPWQYVAQANPVRQVVAVRLLGHDFKTSASEAN